MASSGSPQAIQGPLGERCLDDVAGCPSDLGSQCAASLRRPFEVGGLGCRVVLQAGVPLTGIQAALVAGHELLACKKLDYPLPDVGVQHLADMAIGDGVKAAGDHHVTVGVHFHRPDLAQGEGLCRQRQEGRLLVLGKQPQRRLMG